jgi:TatD DNase family protein
MTAPALVDTHAHLCSPELAPDLEAVLERASLAGVAGIVAVGETLADAEFNLRLAQAHPWVRPAAGLYPTVLDPVQAQAVETFIRAHRHHLVAVGEVGLDRWMVKTEPEREVQRTIFAGFIRLAIELDLPLNVHSRSAGREAVALLLALGARRVQLHAFDGRAAAALPGVEAGYCYSIPPSVVRSVQKQKLVRRLPLDCLLVETDSPVLGPEPGARNEPANLPVALEAIARIKGIPLAEAAEAVTANTRRLYGMP